MVVLQWSQSDLTRMISKRMMYHLVQEGIAQESEFNKIDWKNYNEVKRTVWDRYLPEKLVNLNKASEKTHLYILRHTQHTPRELIRLMNDVISCLEYHIDRKHNIEQWRKAIIEGVHKTCGKTVKEIINSNSYLIPNLREILTISFQSKPKIINIDNIKTFLTDSIELWSEKFMSKEDLIIEALIKIGFLGLVLNYEPDDIIIRTSYAYLNPDVSHDPNCYLAIHPMYYEIFNIRQEDDKIVHPISNIFDYLTSIYNSN